MNTLDEAWTWYKNADRQVRLLKRIADRYWDALPWDGLLGRDDRFNSLDNRAVSAEADKTLAPLKDLAVVVLFSVFETIARERVQAEVSLESARLRHPALKLAAEDVRRAIDEGSFFRVLEPFKKVNADLVEEVDQVRDYRNWVAHGRRGERPPTVTPKAAYERLSRFLTLLEPLPPEWVI